MLATIDMQWSVREMPLEGGMGCLHETHKTFRNTGRKC